MITFSASFTPFHSILQNTMGLISFSSCCPVFLCVLGDEVKESVANNNRRSPRRGYGIAANLSPTRPYMMSVARLVEVRICLNAQALSRFHMHVGITLGTIHLCPQKKPPIYKCSLIFWLLDKRGMGCSAMLQTVCGQRFFDFIIGRKAIYLNATNILSIESVFLNFFF